MRSTALLTTSFLLISIVSTVRCGENFGTPGAPVNSGIIELQSKRARPPHNGKGKNLADKGAKKPALNPELLLTGQDGVKEFIVTPGFSASNYYNLLELEKEKGPSEYLVGHDYRSAPAVSALGLSVHNLSEVSTKKDALAKLNLLRNIYDMRPKGITFSRTYDNGYTHLQNFEPIFGEHCTNHNLLLKELLTTEKTYNSQLISCRALLMQTASKMQVVLDPSLLKVFENIIFQFEKLIENSHKFLEYIPDLIQANDENKIADSEEAMISLVNENFSRRFVSWLLIYVVVI